MKKIILFIVLMLLSKLSEAKCRFICNCTNYNQYTTVYPNFTIGLPDTTTILINNGDSIRLYINESGSCQLYNVYWLFNGDTIYGTTISNNHSSFIITHDPGVYSVHYVGDFSGEITFNIVLNPAAISEYDFPGNLTIYPNPFKDILSIEFQNKQCKEITFSIRNVLGETVFTTTENKPISNFKTELDVSTLSKGVYFLEATMDEEKITRKLIKE